MFANFHISKPLPSWLTVIWPSSEQVESWWRTLFFTSVGTTRGQGIIRVVVVVLVLHALLADSRQATLSNFRCFSSKSILKAILQQQTQSKES